MSATVKHPEVTVELSGKDGNPFMVVGLAKRALLNAGVPGDEVKAFCDEAFSGDNDNVLGTVFRWMSVS